MKIAIVAPSPVPFLIGGAEKLFWGLQHHMNQLTPHEVELIKIPCRDQEFWPMMDAYARSSRLDLSYFDLVISTKYPAWMVPHRNHHLYLQHTCRGVYDLYDLSQLPLDFDPSHPALEKLVAMLDHPHPDSPLLEPFFQELFRLRDLKELPRETFAYPGPLTRAIIRWLDRIAMSPERISSYSAISRNVALREGYFPPGTDVEVIHHPSDREEFHNAGYGDYLFTASRLEGLKRMDLLIKAFMTVDADIELRIAGTGGQEDELKRLAAPDGRIRFLGFVTDAEVIRQYAGALFVPFIPYDEDYGLITLEAMQSSKAVLTTLDSGGVNELVRENYNGRAVLPEVNAIAEGLRQMIADREETIRMGSNAKASVSHISWENTVFGLLREDGRYASEGKAKRKKVVGTATFQIHPPVSGGRTRLYHLNRELARKAEVVFVSLTNNHASLRVTPSLGFVEVAVGRTREESLHIGELQTLLKASIEDIASIDGYRLNPAYVKALARECKDADLVMASHPYLYPAIREVYGGRIWYEAQDVEYDVKAAVLPESPNRDAYLERVRGVEQQCILDAERILAVSEADKERFIELYGVDEKKVLIVQNGMDFRAAAANRLSGDAKKALKSRLGLGDVPVALFIGAYHGPNIEALKAIKEMAPHCPELLFLVAGSVCHHEEAQEMPENVRPLDVLDEDEKIVVLNCADIALNPVVAGSGSNLKLLEYIAYDIPVLTTPFGNRGYGLENKKHLLMAGIEEFPAVINHSLSADPESLRDMAQNARLFAASRYDWSVIMAGILPYFA